MCSANRLDGALALVDHQHFTLVAVRANLHIRQRDAFGWEAMHVPDQMHVPAPVIPPGDAVREPIRLLHRLPHPICYVMAGGGAHGSVQWGLLQALAETDIEPDTLVGTSAGSLTSAIVSEDPLSAVSRLSYVWSQLDLDVLVGDSWMSMLTAATRKNVSLADNATERATLEAILVARDFADLRLPTAAVATDLATGRATAFDSGELIPALLASSAIPGMLPPVTIGGRTYIDGLASANLPARIAVERGAKSIVVLDTGSREQPPVSASPTKVVSRVNSILNASQRRAQLAYASARVPVLVLPTPENLGAALDFRGTMMAASSAYELARQFLFDASRSRARTKLKPGLYARPERYAHDPDLSVFLHPVGRAGAAHG